MWDVLQRLHREGQLAFVERDTGRPLWGFVGEANRYVDAQKPWEVAKAIKNGDESAEPKLRDVLGNLLEACRVISFAAAPFMPETAARAAEQLGIEYTYGADGNGGPPLLDVLAWGALESGGSIGEPAPLFPRLEADAADGSSSGPEGG